MKVWHLISNRWNSAISEYALSAARALKLAGAETLITPLQSSPIEARFIAHEFSVESVDHFGPSKYGRLVALSKKFDPDIIFTYGGPETTAAMFIKNGRKLIRFYGQRADGLGMTRQFFGRVGHFHVDRLIAPSYFVGEPLRGITGGEVDVVPLGCDQKKFSFLDTSRAKRPEILIFGRLDPVKGHREFLPILKELIIMAKSKGDPIPRLRIVGMPANLSPSHLRAEADQFDLSEDDLIIQCEQVANVAALMSESSLGLVSSLGSEVICRVAQEFLLCGTPVITTGVGSLPEVFVDKSFGNYYDHTKPAEAAAKIYNWLCLGHCESNLQRQARSLAAKRVFSIERMAEDLIRIVRSTLS
jgi:glycosyltransferase involved in cell wall biosynthesis